MSICLKFVRMESSSMFRGKWVWVGGDLCCVQEVWGSSGWSLAGPVSLESCWLWCNERFSGSVWYMHSEWADELLHRLTLHEVTWIRPIHHFPSSSWLNYFCSLSLSLVDNVRFRVPQKCVTWEPNTFHHICLPQVCDDSLHSTFPFERRATRKESSRWESLQTLPINTFSSHFKCRLLPSQPSISTTFVLELSRITQHPPRDHDQQQRVLSRKTNLTQQLPSPRYRYWWDSAKTSSRFHCSGPGIGNVSLPCSTVFVWVKQESWPSFNIVSTTQICQNGTGPWIDSKGFIISAHWNDTTNRTALFQCLHFTIM